MMSEFKNLMYPSVAFVVFVCLLGLAGNMEIEDEIAQAQLYCENVYSGVWPDYDNTYSRMCKDGQYVD